MTLSQIRQRVNYLQRKFAVALKVIRARTLADEVSQRWTIAQANHRPLPDPEDVLDFVRDAGIRNASFLGLRKYIRRCLEEDRTPQPEGFLPALLPRAEPSGLIRAALRWDPPASDPNEYRPRPYTGAVFPLLA